MDSTFNEHAAQSACESDGVDEKALGRWSGSLAELLREMLLIESGEPCAGLLQKLDTCEVGVIVDVDNSRNLRV